MDILPENYVECLLWSRSWRQRLKDKLRLIQWKLSLLGTKDRSFKLAGNQYSYFAHTYNRTWLHERAVEIPVIWDAVQENKGKRILEVGNVLSHYFKVSHDVIDKYEKEPGVINEDIIDFSPAQPYDLIVSISTLEHVGWDEHPRQPNKVIQAIDRLKSLVAPGGRCIVTVPLGYNDVLDQFLQSKDNPFQHCLFLERMNLKGDWKEIQVSQAWQSRYGEHFPAANQLLIAEYRA